jgi:nitroreductase
MDREALHSWIVSRRSIDKLGDPGPSQVELSKILAAAGTVPDHGQLRPYRFVIVTGDGRAAFGQALAEAAKERKPETPEPKLEAMRAKALRSPTLVAIIASPKPGKIETWEQVATASCTGYAIVLAANALGIGAVWKSVPFTRGKGITELFALGPTEEMLGWIHLGTPQKANDPRPPLDIATVTTLMDGTAPRPFTP